MNDIDQFAQIEQIEQIEQLENWVAARLPENTKRPDIPINALIEDADRAMAFVEKYWVSTSERPGLEGAGFGLTRDVIAEISGLKTALLEIDRQHAELLKLDLDKKRYLSKAEQLLFELSTLLEWYIASTDERDVVSESEWVHSGITDVDRDSPDELAHALYDYASLSRVIFEQVDEVGGLSETIVDEANDVVMRLVDISNNPAALSPATQKMISLKYSLSALLHRSLEKLRKAAYFVFRAHPEISQEIGSTYAIKRQAAQYRVEKVNRKFYESLKQDVPLRFMPEV